jgi:NAD(P)-dependent dehydrogenase (short-subunit alcohol dehydrogenase family)
MTSSRLANDVVVVTGAAQGIGRSIAGRCAAEGAAVVAVDVDEPGLAETAGAIDADRLVTVAGDVTDTSLSEEVVATARARFGPPTGLVNNAAVLFEADTVTTTEDQWDRTLAVNLTAPWQLARAVIPGMVEAGRGSIVNIASIEAHSVRANHAAYVAAKAGLVGLTKAIAIDYGRKGVRCNSISPGSISTEMFRNYVAAADDPEALEAALIAMNYRGRLGRPGEIAGLVAYLLSDECTFANGADFVVDGGRLSAT